MPAPKGNSNAEKWTVRDTIAKLQQLKQYADLAHINTLGTALAKVDLYDGIWTYWRRRWADHDEIMHRMSHIDQLFMSKVIEGALNKRLHAGMAMFILRAKHGMRDKPLQKNEREPEEKLEPHLQRQLDREQKAREITAEPATAPVQPEKAAPATPAEAPAHRTVGHRIITTYTAAQNPILASDRSYYEDGELGHTEPLQHKPAA